MRSMNLLGLCEDGPVKEASPEVKVENTSPRYNLEHVKSILDLMPGSVVSVDIDVVQGLELPELPGIKTGLSYKVVYVSPERVGIQRRPNYRRFWISKQLMEKSFVQHIGPVSESSIAIGAEFMAISDGAEYTRGDCCQVVDVVNHELLNMETGRQFSLPRQEITSNFEFIA